jgi:hypothetical protein
MQVRFHLRLQSAASFVTLILRRLSDPVYCESRCSMTRGRHYSPTQDRIDFERQCPGTGAVCGLLVGCPGQNVTGHSEPGVARPSGCRGDAWFFGSIEIAGTAYYLPAQRSVRAKRTVCNLPRNPARIFAQFLDLERLFCCSPISRAATPIARRSRSY